MKLKNFPLKSLVILAAAAFVPAGTIFVSVAIYHAIPGVITLPIQVTASVNAKCKISNPTTVAFGDYDPIDVNSSAPLDASGSFQISCTKGTTATLTINNGLHYSSGRRMIGNSVATTYLNYELYTTAARTTIWDSTPGGSVIYVGNNASKFTETVYGRIPAGQDVEAQAYSDTVTVTATF